LDRVSDLRSNQIREIELEGLFHGAEASVCVEQRHTAAKGIERLQRPDRIAFYSCAHTLPNNRIQINEAPSTKKAIDVFSRSANRPIKRLRAAGSYGA
jgi:hypothetical protein